MRFWIRQESKCRMRVHLDQKRMSYNQADILQYYLENTAGVQSAKVYDRTSDAVICYTGARSELIRALQQFRYEKTEVPANVLEHSGRELNETYKEKLINKVVLHYGRRWLLPYPINACYTAIHSVTYIYKGLKTLWNRKIEVPVLDGTAIGVSVLRGDFTTAGSIMFLLGIGELLEEWTHKKSVGDLARTMSLNVSKVWLKRDGQEILVSADQIHEGDYVVIHMGNVIPFDGVIRRRCDGQSGIPDRRIRPGAQNDCQFRLCRNRC